MDQTDLGITLRLESRSLSAMIADPAGEGAGRSAGRALCTAHKMHFRVGHLVVLLSPFISFSDFPRYVVVAGFFFVAEGESFAAPEHPSNCCSPVPQTDRLIG